MHIYIHNYSAPPEPTALSVEVYCDCTWSLTSFRSVTISWSVSDMWSGLYNNTNTHSMERKRWVWCIRGHWRSVWYWNLEPLPVPIPQPAVPDAVSVSVVMETTLSLSH